MRRRRGFTLIEVIFASAAIAVIFIVLGTLTRAAQDGIAMINAQGLLDINLAQATEFLQRDASLTIETATSCCGGAHVATAGSPTGINSKLILKVYAVDATGLVLDPTYFDYIIYEHLGSLSMLGRTVWAHDQSARPEAYATRILPPAAPQRWAGRQAPARLAMDWLMPPAYAMGNPPPPPPGLTNHWVGVASFTYTPTETNQFIDVTLNGLLAANTGHGYKTIVHCRAVFKGTLPAP